MNIDNEMTTWLKVTRAVGGSKSYQDSNISVNGASTGGDDTKELKTGNSFSSSRKTTAIPDCKEHHIVSTSRDRSVARN